MTLNNYQHDSNGEPKSHGEQCLRFYLVSNSVKRTVDSCKERTEVAYLSAHLLSYISLLGEMVIIYSLQKYRLPWVNISYL